LIFSSQGWLLRERMFSPPWKRSLLSLMCRKVRFCSCLRHRGTRFFWFFASLAIFYELCRAQAGSQHNVHTPPTPPQTPPTQPPPQPPPHHFFLGLPGAPILLSRFGGRGLRVAGVPPLFVSTFFFQRFGKSLLICFFWSPLLRFLLLAPPLILFLPSKARKVLFP